MFRIQPGGSETFPGVDTGDKHRLAGEVHIYRDLWDSGREFEVEVYRSVCVESEGNFCHRSGM